jgi:fimbrial isopeptide formation D2 family protein/LPXTG-motif cell wall-anchored protein
VGVAVLSTVAFSTPASADPAFGNIDTTKTGSITLHKHLHQTTTSVVGDPEGPGATIPSDPVANVVFTAYKLTDFDVTDRADWDTLAVQPAVPANACDSTPPTVHGWTVAPTGVAFPGTSSTGVATRTTTELGGLGAYLICETSAPADIVDRAAPFIVTVPFPDNQTGAPSNSLGWLYDVHAYPKNGKTVVDKTINEQEGLGLGSVVEFPVTAQVPQLAPGRDFTSFDIEDTLDSRLTLTPAADGVGVGVTSVKLDGNVVNASYYTVTTTGQKIEVKFNVSLPAVQTLLKNNALKNVEVVFAGTVNSLGTGDTAGVIKNQATVYINNPADQNGGREEPGVPTPEVNTNWGDVRVLKFDADEDAEEGKETPLEGATFEVYPAADPYAATCGIEIADGAAPISVGVGAAATTTFTSDELGLVFIAGLFVSDSENEPKNAEARCYVLVETAAPAGFVTPTGDDAKTALTVRTGATATTTWDGNVPNVKNDMPDLPLTGAQGQLVLMTLGAVLVLGGGALLLVLRKRAGRTLV